MAMFAELERIISSQTEGISAQLPADVLARIGCSSTSIAILDHGSITGQCFSTIGDNDETLFQACSVSKTIAGMATMKLIQQGKLKLEGEIAALLPRSVMELLETPETKRLLAGVTIKHLMSHTSGLSVHGFPGYSTSHPDVLTVISGKSPANTPQVRLQGMPGYAMSYSGGGITVLQLVLETVAGEPFSSIVRKLVFEPLGMKRSFYSLPGNETNIAQAYYTGYTACEDRWRSNPEQAAAGLWTTPSEILKVVRALQESLVGNKEGNFLEKEIAQQMLTEVSDGMALTWYAPKDPGLGFGHPGSNVPGWNCFVLGYADLLPANSEKPPRKALADCGICVMTNSAIGDDVIWKMLHTVSFLMQWPQVPNLYGFQVSVVPLMARNVNVNAEWKEWAGAWEDKNGKWAIEADSNGLPMARFGTPEFAVSRLVPAAIPGAEYPEGQSIDLILEGLEMMLRLCWKEGKRALEVWYGANGEAVLLEREGEKK